MAVITTGRVGTFVTDGVLAKGKCGVKPSSESPSSLPPSPPRHAHCSRAPQTLPCDASFVLDILPSASTQPPPSYDPDFCVIVNATRKANFSA